jgi:DNA-binding CsgD family transcriptional regulator
MPAALLEREPLLAQLDHAVVATAASSGGRAVLVVGEAGIGKTALLREFVRQRQGDVRFLVGLCDPLLTPRALGPLYDIARQVGGTLAARLAEGAARESVFAAFLDEVERGGRQAVLIEDAHWADEATQDLLLFVGRRLDRLPLTLIVTFRDDELGPDHPLRAVLTGLPPDRVRQLRPAPLSEPAISELADRAGRSAAGVRALTGGNPLLVTELLSADAPGVPGSILDLAVARLGGLPVAAQEAVRLVAVVPNRTELWLLDAALAPDPALVEAGVAAGLLVLSSDAIAFRHELIRQAVDASLSAPRRRELNRQILTVLAATADRAVDPARLVHHARQADDGAAVLRYAPAAARAAAALGAHREAAGHCRAALHYADRLTDTDRAELLEALSFHAYLTSEVDEALASRHAALGLREGAGQIVAAGDDWRWLSRLYWWAGRRREAEDAAASAIARLEGGPPSRELAMAYSNQAQLDMLARRLAPSIEWGTRALRIARQIGDTETIAHALTNIGTSRLNGGDERGRAELAQAAELAIGERLPDHAVRALLNVAYSDLEARNYRPAEHELDRAIVFAFDRDLTSYLQYVLGTRAWWRLDQGDWAGAERDAREVLKQHEQPGTSIVPALVTWGKLQSRRGDDAAAATLDEASRRAVGMGEVQRLAPVASARAEHAWLTGESERAAEEARPGFEAAVETRHPWFAGELAWWLYRSGAPVEVPTWVAEPYRLSLAGDWRGAAAAWGRLGCPYERAEALAEADEKEALLEALDAFDALGAVPAARRLRRRLARLGGVRIPRGPRPATTTNPAHLTARQLEVVQLLAGRLSNADIASRLSLSVRTVDHHVSAVLSKLGVESRAEAVDAAQRLGIRSSRSGSVGRPM